jgi:3-hydroxyisobutyrate dehydrogenase-like beta-hydroxyacid dehydrogenase
MDKPRIGFVGLGMMGHGMAKNLLAKGFPLSVKAFNQAVSLGLGERLLASMIEAQEKVNGMQIVTR